MGMQGGWVESVPSMCEKSSSSKKLFCWTRLHICQALSCQKNCKLFAENSLTQQYMMIENRIVKETCFLQQMAQFISRYFEKLLSPGLHGERRNHLGLERGKSKCTCNWLWLFSSPAVNGSICSCLGFQTTAGFYLWVDCVPLSHLPRPFLEWKK